MFPGLTTKVSEGPIIASATTIYPKNDVIRVSGVAAIETIKPAFGGGFSGILFVVPTGIFTWTTAGNIGLAGTAVVGKLIVFVYLKSTGKWYPSVVA